MVNTPNPAVEDSSPGIGYPEPTEQGFYRYTEGAQKIIFLLGPDKEWFAYFDNGEGPLNCDWGYIEQALGSQELIRIESDSDYVVQDRRTRAMELAIRSMGQNAHNTSSARLLRRAKKIEDFLLSGRVEDE